MAADLISLLLHQLILFVLELVDLLVIFFLHLEYQLLFQLHLLLCHFLEHIFLLADELFHRFKLRFGELFPPAEGRDLSVECFIML